jgi:small subunit ribosomal protein S17
MPRRILEGEVVSDRANKTVTVLVERKYMHPVYKKYIRKSDKYAAHDEHNQFKAGDIVQIEECRPISKSKRWTVITESTAAKNAERPKVQNDDDAHAGKKNTPKKETSKKEAAKTEAKAEKPAAKKETAKKQTKKKTK